VYRVAEMAGGRVAEFDYAESVAVCDVGWCVGAVLPNPPFPRGLIVFRADIVFVGCKMCVVAVIVLNAFIPGMILGNRGWRSGSLAAGWRARRWWR
jgi:hypothetical protein